MKFKYINKTKIEKNEGFLYQDDVKDVELMKWTNIKDEIPKPGLYIIYVPEHTPSLCIDEFTDASGNLSFCHELFFTSKVTHWMPLPKPPIEEASQPASSKG